MYTSDEVVVKHISVKETVLKLDLEPKGQSHMYTSDEVVVKHISVKETVLKLELEPKGQGHSKQTE